MPRLTRKYATGSGNLTNAFSAIALKGDSANDEGSEDVPAVGFLDHLEAEVTAIAGGCTEITWFLARDAAGDRPLTPGTVTAITIGMTTAAKGGIDALIQKLFMRVHGDTVGELWLIAKTNAGTCTVRARPHFDV
jgi:hypothetical protein